MPEQLTRFLRIRNVSRAVQYIGAMHFAPGEEGDLPDRMAKALVEGEAFEWVKDEPAAPLGAESSARRAASGFAAEVRAAILPDPPVPDWIQDLNRECFPCQTNEFDPVAKAKKTFSVTFRVHSLNELSGGVRVILSVAGYLAARGHQVAVSAYRLPVSNDDLEGTGVRLTRGIEDADFVVGTYWPTINEVARAGLAGRKVAFLQSDEPSWMETSNRHTDYAASVEAFTHPGVAYIAISRHVAESCVRNYGTKIVCNIGGNGVDGIDFAPRLNNFERRNAVCAIYRGVWFKNDTFPIEVAQRLKAEVPNMRLLMAGFKRFGNPMIDEYLCNPTREEMALLYSRSDFYVSGSLIEGSPLPPLEAAACGCIPVVTRIGTEEYLEDGVNGLVINADQPQEALARILAVYEDDGLRRTLMRNALRTARERPWSMVCEAFEGMLYAMQS